MHRRGSGVLLHVTSLPSRYGIGDLGPGAYRFVDFMAQTQQKYWQILPLNPTTAINGYSPYSCLSVFAGNPLLISPEKLVADGYLLETDIQPDAALLESSRVDYPGVEVWKQCLLRKAYAHFLDMPDKSAYAAFCSKQRFWLEDFALFMTLKTTHDNKGWFDWPVDLRLRDAVALEGFKAQNRSQIEYRKFLEFLFYQQWMELKTYCHQRGVTVIGDIPIYVNYDSVDVWTSPGLFKLDEQLHPTVVAGVPPDYFSETGQRWGNPLYDWGALQERRFKWWVDRFRHNFHIFDMVRIDHFRGLVQCWEIPVDEPTAIKGKWEDVPHEDFFGQLLKSFQPFPIIAEDLGTITPDVEAVMERYGFPGMKVLLFAFGEEMDEKHPYLPQNYDTNAVVYTGTHDNNTVRGWYEQETSAKTRKTLQTYLGHDLDPDRIHWTLIELAMRSKADIALFPIQDVLGLAAEARMNTPGTVVNNWAWRLEERLLADQDARNRLRELTVQSERS